MEPRTERWNLLWSVQRSARYHARRQAFFDTWRRVTAALGVIFGSAAAVDLLHASTSQGHSVGIAAAFVVAVASALDLVVGTSDMAWQHRELRKRFLELECQIRRCPDKPRPEELARWREFRIGIEADEPPTYVAVDLLCENELARANGAGDRAKLNPWERATAHWLKWHDLASIAAERMGNN